MENSKEIEVSIQNVSYKYPGMDGQALKEINVEVTKGEIVLITGPNAAGKTTFCNLLNGLVPHFFGGILEGNVKVHDIETQKSFPGRLSTIVGLLFQEPSSQLITASVEDEVAFALENIGKSIEEINERVKEALKFVGLHGVRDRPPFALSGGQQQALALAAILALEPDIYVLDEPTSNLDPLGTKEVFDLLHEVAERERKTFIIVEHDLEALIDIIDRVIVLNNGEKVADGSPIEILGQRAEYLKEQLGLRPPQVALLTQELKVKGILFEDVEIPLNLEEAVEIYSQYFEKNKDKIPTEPYSSDSSPTSYKEERDPIISVQNLHFSYPDGTVALRGVSLDAYENEFIGIIGQNGSGKTTLVKHFNGLLKPTKGTVTVYGKDTKVAKTHDLIRHVGYVFQNPDQQLFSRDVESELRFAPKNLELSNEEVDKRVNEIAKRMDIEHLLEKNTFSLSQGERQRVAISSLLTLDPEVIIVDEPTTGQDPKRRREIMDLMKEFHKEGKTIIVITHDMSLIAEYAERCIVLNNGKVMLRGTPKEVFIQKETLAQTDLEPPTITQLFIELNEKYDGVPKDILTANEAINYFKNFKIKER